MSAPSTTCAISLIKTVGPAPFLIGIFSNSATFSSIVFVGVMYIRFPIRMLPAGATVLFSAKAFTISSGEIFLPFIKSGFTFISIVLAFPPKGGGEETPGIAANNGRILVEAKSCISFKLLVSLLNTICPTGSDDASNLTTIGGKVVDGIWALALLTWTETSAAACAISVPG